MSGVVAQLDHVVLESGDERVLFDFFHQTLGLPVAWPIGAMQESSQGGINIGDCTIICRRCALTSSDEPRIAAVAFEPAGGLDRALLEMGRLGLEHTEPFSSGPVAELPQPWNAGCRRSRIVRPTPTAFLYEYGHDTSARRREQAAAFSAHRNTFGVTGLEGVWCNTTDFTGWETLLGDERLPGPWIAQDDSIGAGVDLDEWWGLYLRVESLEDAAQAASTSDFSIGRQRRGDGPWKPDINARALDFMHFVDTPVW